MKFGLQDKDYLFILNEVVIPLRKMGVEVLCFGSRARGDHNKFSDLDLLIENKNTDIKSILSQLRERLEDSHFPYKVDLVPISEIPDSYKNQILREKREF